MGPTALVVSLEVVDPVFSGNGTLSQCVIRGEWEADGRGVWIFC